MENHFVNYNEHSCALRREEEGTSRAFFFTSIFYSLVVVLVAQLCPNLCDPMDCGILQARKPFHSLYFHKLSATKWTVCVCVCVYLKLYKGDSIIQKELKFWEKLC